MKSLSGAFVEQLGNQLAYKEAEAGCSLQTQTRLIQNKSTYTLSLTAANSPVAAILQSKD